MHGVPSFSHKKVSAIFLTFSPFLSLFTIFVFFEFLLLASLCRIEGKLLRVLQQNALNKFLIYYIAFPEMSLLLIFKAFKEIHLRHFSST
jgi:hypothetical protein